MKLLARWDRRGGAIGQREVRHLQRATFDDAMEALEKKLRNPGIPIPPLPPPSPGHTACVRMTPNRSPTASKPAELDPPTHYPVWKTPNTENHSEGKEGVN